LGNDTVQANLLLHHPADARSYGVATAILMDLNLHRIALLTNNPDKIVAVEGPNKEITVAKRVKMIPKAWRGEVGVEGKEVGEYLKTKVLSNSLIKLMADSKNGTYVGFTVTTTIGMDRIADDKQCT
jgi:GTP cyclohydrolase II